MILELLMDNLFKWIEALLSLVPVMNFEFSIDGIETFLGYFDMVGFFVPMDTVLLLIGVLVSFETVKIIIAFARFVWKFIPIFGN